MYNQNYDYMMRLLVVGNSSVGKTSLLNRFSDNKFSNLFIPTVGIDFAVKNMQIDEKIIKVQIFDTAGQERFKSIISSYFKNADGVLLVFDIGDEESFNHIDEYWLPEIDKSSKSDVKYILVGNKSDLEEKRAISFEKANDYAKKIGTFYIETSAKCSINVNEAFTAIVKDIYIRKKMQNPIALQEEQMVLNKKKETENERGCFC